MGAMKVLPPTEFVLPASDRVPAKTRERFPSHPKRPAAAIAVCLLLVCVSLRTGRLPASVPDPEDLKTRLGHHLKACMAGGLYRSVEVGIHIETTDGKQDLYLRHPDRPFTPASVIKVITSGVAMSRFGPDHRFVTLIKTDGEILTGVLEGNLYLVGRGDPALRDTHLREAVRFIRSSGIRKIKGDLVFDVSFLDEEAPRYPPNARHLYAPPSALTVNHNWLVIGYDRGPPVRLWTVPQTGYARLDYRVEFSPSDRPGLPALTYRAESWGDRYDIRGKITRWDLRYKVLRLCVSRPGLFAATLFQEACTREGLKLMGIVRQGVAGTGTRTIHTIRTRPLEDILRELNRESNNVVAELVNKDLGAHFKSPPGTREKGLDVLREYCIAPIGLRPGSFTLDDASGLSHGNRFSPRQITRILNHFYQKLGKRYARTLAPQGHHAHALRPVPPEGIRMFVKSGTLPSGGVNTVAGYIFRTGRSPLSFAIMAIRKGPGAKAYSGTYTIPLLAAMLEALGSPLSNRRSLVYNR